jgi:hypothetical protein
MIYNKNKLEEINKNTKFYLIEITEDCDLQHNNRVYKKATRHIVWDFEISFVIANSEMEQIPKDKAEVVCKVKFEEMKQCK